MIQDIYPEVYKNHYEEREAKEGDLLILVKGRNPIARTTETNMEIPSVREVLEKAPELKKDLVFLFEISGVNYFGFVDNDAAFKKAETILTENGCTAPEFRWFREVEPKVAGFAAVTAASLYGWYRGNRFCGSCGKSMKRDSKERMMKCPDCGHMVYPKICPGVIVGVINGDSILLTRYRGRTTGYALIAGFTEIGEPLEDTVRREVMEEAGVRVKNLHYYKSQPWSFSDTLLMGFYCEVDKADDIHMDEEELGFAQWVLREEIPVGKDRISLTAEMIERFRVMGRDVLNS